MNLLDKILKVGTIILGILVAVVVIAIMVLYFVAPQTFDSLRDFITTVIS